MISGRRQRRRPLWAGAHGMCRHQAREIMTAGRPDAAWAGLLPLEQDRVVPSQGGRIRLPAGARAGRRWRSCRPHCRRLRRPGRQPVRCRRRGATSCCAFLRPCVSWPVRVAAFRTSSSESPRGGSSGRRAQGAPIALCSVFAAYGIPPGRPPRTGAAAAPGKGKGPCMHGPSGCLAPGTGSGTPPIGAVGFRVDRRDCAGRS